MTARNPDPLRGRIVYTLFETLYRNRLLYWFASTIPFAGQWRTWQRLVIPHLRGHDVLEVGCGIGTLVADMVRAGYVCTAVDRSPQMVAATRARLRRHGLSTTSVFEADVRQLPFAGASFDSVVSTFPTDYIFDPAALSEITRVLRPGGRLVIVIGAEILPVNALTLPFVGIQTLVYGRRARTEPKTAETLPVAKENLLLALMARAGLHGRREGMRGPFWEATLYIGEKS
ncbi:MAG: Methyltransferase type 11 [Ktedonobacterales bacterium]|nr:MAG: Methyltransferase type 11 [Ktedonobacterales bacterium]